MTYTNHGVKPDPAKVDDVEGMPTPEGTARIFRFVSISVTICTKIYPKSP